MFAREFANANDRNERYEKKTICEICVMRYLVNVAHLFYFYDNLWPNAKNITSNRNTYRLRRENK